MSDDALPGVADEWAAAYGRGDFATCLGWTLVLLRHCAEPASPTHYAVASATARSVLAGYDAGRAARERLDESERSRRLVPHEPVSPGESP